MVADHAPLRGHSGTLAKASDTPLVEIRTERLILRRPRLADLPAVVAACQDSEISRFIPYIPVPYGEADGRTFLDSVERAWEESDERTFAICGEDNLLIGAVTVRLREEGTVGYWLAPGARGHGVMTEAVTAVVRWAREEQGIERLRLWTHPLTARPGWRTCRLAHSTVRRSIGMSAARATSWS
jgi:RimJ/RimL family protein N-acetyltransferase